MAEHNHSTAEAFQIDQRKLEEDEETEEESDADESKDDEEHEQELERIVSELPVPLVVLTDRASTGAESRKSETLPVTSQVFVADSDRQFNCESTSQETLGLPMSTTAQWIESANLERQATILQKGPSASNAQAQTDNQHLQSPDFPTSSSELSPTSVTQSISSVPSPIQKASPQPMVKVNTKDPCDPSDVAPISVVPVVKIPYADGYNWRKYGQKQVKSPKGSRSYYKCTFSECYAKKVECCDHSGLAIEIIYRGQHNHEPPRKVNSIRDNRLALPAKPDIGSDISSHTIRMLDNSDPSTSSKEPILDETQTSERKRQNLGSGQNAELNVKEEHVDEPDPKRRVKKSAPGYSGSLLKSGKKPKFVVHAAGDVGISGDGYRWRKYGQKMVKGNPHPRNYYRCTSAGCPVRKHIERAVDSTSAVIITYKGVHDHGMPVPKKRHGPPSAPLVAASAPVSMNNFHLQKAEENHNQEISSTQWSVDREGELTGEALELGQSEKAVESARTLVSIGFEIKPC